MVVVVYIITHTHVDLYFYSAGVGRTGTLVALDSLLQQLADEGHVAIFNTVCDLRHQRNFLVQSLVSFLTPLFNYLISLSLKRYV
jgi:protein tyrosine phosphatase